MNKSDDFRFAWLVIWANNYMETTANEIRNHPMLGLSRNDTSGCSKCGAEISEHADMPFIVWSQDGRAMWVFCSKCEAPMFHQLWPKHMPKPKGKT